MQYWWLLEGLAFPAMNPRRLENGSADTKQLVTPGGQWEPGQGGGPQGLRLENTGLLASAAVRLAELAI